MKSADTPADNQPPPVSQGGDAAASDPRLRLRTTEVDIETYVPSRTPWHAYGLAAGLIASLVLALAEWIRLTAFADQGLEGGLSSLQTLLVAFTVFGFVCVPIGVGFSLSLIGWVRWFRLPALWRRLAEDADFAKRHEPRLASIALVVPIEVVATGALAFWIQRTFVRNMNNPTLGAAFLALVLTAGLAALLWMTPLLLTGLASLLPLLPLHRLLRRPPRLLRSTLILLGAGILAALAVAFVLLYNPAVWSRAWVVFLFVTAVLPLVLVLSGPLIRWARILRHPAVFILVLAAHGAVTCWSYSRLAAWEPAGQAVLSDAVFTPTLTRIIQRLTDRDGDGQSALLSGGDCDDSNPSVYAGAPEIPGNGIDDNCLGGDAPADRPPDALDGSGRPRSLPDPGGSSQTGSPASDDPASPYVRPDAGNGPSSANTGHPGSADAASHPGESSDPAGHPDPSAAAGYPGASDDPAGHPDPSAATGNPVTSDDPAGHPDPSAATGNPVSSDDPVFFAGVLSGAGTGPGTGSGSAQGSNPANLDSVSAASPRGNIVIIMVDALRPDHLGFFGYQRDLSPNMDGLARQSIVFDRAYAQAPHTPRSIPSIFLSRYPSAIDFRNPGSNYPVVRDSNLSLFEVLNDFGYLTVGLASHYYFEPRRGMDQGFDHFDNRGALTIAETNEVITAPDIFAHLEERVPELMASTDPFCLFIHYYEPHARWMPHPEVVDFGPASGHDRHINNYDSEIAFVDGYVGRTFDLLRENGWFEDSLIVLLSDHGEAFNEHGRYFHGQSLYEEEIRTVLFFKVPGQDPVRIQTPVSLLDVAPTILAWAGAPIPDVFQGRPLLPDPASLAPVDILSELLPYSNFQQHLVTLLSGDHKLIYDVTHRRFELYDLAADPTESDNLYRTSDRAESMRQYLIQWLER